MVEGLIYFFTNILSDLIEDFSRRILIILVRQFHLRREMGILVILLIFNH